MYIIIYIYIYIYIYIFIGYRLCRRPLMLSAGDDFCLYFGSPGSPRVLPTSLLQHLGCTGLTRAAKVGYLTLPQGRQHRFQGHLSLEGCRPVPGCGALWRKSPTPLR